MADPGVEPDVQNVLLLAELRAAALRATRLRRQQLPRGTLEPRIGALPLEPCGDVIGDLARDQRVTACRAEKRHDRHAPVALARDAPVGTEFHHAANPLATPLRN